MADTAQAPGRLPPHNLQAEESLLGAMLLNRDAIAATRHLTEPADFYKPAHGHIYAAILHLHDQGEPADTVTVADELRRAGLLDAIGGPAALTDLVAGTPHTSHVDGYARIVAELAAYRQLIGVGSELVDAAYRGNPDDALRYLHTATATIHQRASPLLEGEDVAAVLRGDVEPIRPTMLRRDDGACLMYPGLTHALSGEPGKGKTMIALHVIAEALDDGRHAFMFDWEGNRRIIGERLAALGVTADQAAEQLTYLRPPVIAPGWTARAVATVQQHHQPVVVIDSVAKSMQRQNLKENEASDVLAWLDLLANPVAEAGAAVLMLDHVTKDTDTRGLWARGNGAKLGEITGAAWMLRPRELFSRHRPGRSDLVQAKDREGHNGADGDIVASVTFTPAHEGRELAIGVHAPIRHDPGTFEPTGIMEAISRELEARGERMSKRTVRTLTRGAHKYVDLALDMLVSQGHVDLDPKKGYASVKPYRAPEPGAPPSGRPDPDEAF